MLGRVVNQTRLVLNNIHYARFIVQSHHRSISISCSRLSSNRIGFVGTGKIAQAIISGLIKKNIFKPEQIYVSDANKEYLNHLKEKSSLFQKNKVNILENNNQIFNETKTVMLCVKPNDMTNLLKEVSNKINSSHLILSIAAGIKLQQIENCLNKDARVIRIMTNTTALIQQSCSVYARGRNATIDDGNYVKNLLEAIGTCENEVKEDLLDAVTGLSGSGPAYMFLILDALADGGVKMGLSRQLSLRLATQTMLGSASMVMSELNSETNGKHLMQMKEEVTSPGGTTIYGIAELEKNKVRSSFIKCVEAATNRAKEMSSKN